MLVRDTEREIKIDGVGGFKINSNTCTAESG